MLKYLLIFAVLMEGCRKPYNPPAIAAPGSYLVVEGVINSGTDSTLITLNRTVSLSSKSTFNPVLGAIVTVQGEQGTSYALTGTGNGHYGCAGLNLDNTHKYRLSINTGNDQYYSDYVSILNAPAIDSLYWTTNSSGLNIYLTTHDPTNNVKYFRWDYHETWMIHSNFESKYYSNGDTVLPRPVGNQVYTCWQSDTSSTILLASTAKLTKSIILNNPIAFVASTAERLGIEYSILVRQYAVTPDAYNFWANLKKNTEQLGGIFDAQPSEISGNIHSMTNPAEPVIGYISVGSITSERIFIRNQQLPVWVPTQPYPNCQANSYLYHAPILGTDGFYNQVDVYINYKKGAVDSIVPINAISGMPGKPPIGYTGAENYCVECTLRGTNIMPSFWQY